MWPIKVKKMNTTLPNTPAESTSPDEPDQPDLPEDAIDKSLPSIDPQEDSAESDGLEPEEPVGTPETNQRES